MKMARLNKNMRKVGFEAIVFLLLLISIVSFGFSKGVFITGSGVFSKNLCNGFVPCTCGGLISVSKNLTSDALSYCKGKQALKIEGNNVVLNCNGKDLSSLNYQGNILVVSGNNITIENCVIHDGNEGILLNGTTNFVIKNSKIYNNYASGIYIVNSKNGIIESNRIYNNWDGIFLLNSSGVVVKGNSITHNKVDGVQLFYNTYDNTIVNNNLTYNDGHGYAPVTCNNVVRNNIAGKGLPILYVSNKKGVRIQGLNNYSEIIFCNVNDSTLSNINIVNSEMRTDGILLVNSNKNVIESSKLKNVRAGVYLYHSSNNNIKYVNVVNSDFGLRFMKESDKNEIENCVLDSDSVFIRLKNSFDNTFSGIMINNEILKFTPLSNFSEIRLDNNKLSYFNIRVEGKNGKVSGQKSYVEKSNYKEKNGGNLESSESGFTWIDYLLIIIFIIGISFSVYFLFLRK